MAPYIMEGRNYGFNRSHNNSGYIWDIWFK